MPNMILSLFILFQLFQLQNSTLFGYSLYSVNLTLSSIFSNFLIPFKDNCSSLL